MAAAAGWEHGAAALSELLATVADGRLTRPARQAPALTRRLGG